MAALIKNKQNFLSQNIELAQLSSNNHQSNCLEKKLAQQLQKKALPIHHLEKEKENLFTKPQLFQSLSKNNMKIQNNDHGLNSILNPDYSFENPTTNKLIFQKKSNKNDDREFSFFGKELVIQLSEKVLSKGADNSYLMLNINNKPAKLKTEKLKSRKDNETNELAAPCYFHSLKITEQLPQGQLEMTPVTVVFDASISPNFYLNNKNLQNKLKINNALKVPYLNLGAHYFDKNLSDLNNTILENNEFNRPHELIPINKNEKHKNMEVDDQNTFGVPYIFMPELISKQTPNFYSNSGFSLALSNTKEGKQSSNNIEENLQNNIKESDSASPFSFNSNKPFFDKNPLPSKDFFTKNNEAHLTNELELKETATKILGFSNLLTELPIDSSFNNDEKLVDSNKKIVSYSNHKENLPKYHFSANIVQSNLIKNSDVTRLSYAMPYLGENSQVELTIAHNHSSPIVKMNPSSEKVQLVLEQNLNKPEAKISSEPSLYRDQNQHQNSRHKFQYFIDDDESAK